MKKLIFFTLLFSFSVILNAQFFSKYSDFEKKYPNVKWECFRNGMNHNSGKVFVADLNKDSKQDFLRVFEYTEVAKNAENPNVYDYYLETHDKFYAFIIQMSSGNAFNCFYSNGFFKDYSEDAVQNIKFENNQLEFTLRHEDFPEYERHMTFEINKRNGFLQLVKDGGKYVIQGHSEKYLSKDELGEIYLQDITDINYINRISIENQEDSKLIRVKNEHEFLKAIGNDRKILIETSKLDFSPEKVEEYKNEFENSPYVSFTDKGIQIRSVNNLTLQGNPKTEMVTQSDEEYIISFYNCSDLTLSNLSLYHEVEPDFCFAAVDSFDYCRNLTIENCQFNGSGLVGLQFNFVEEAYISNSFLFNNSESIIDIQNSKGIEFLNTRFFDNNLTWDMLKIHNSEIDFNDCLFTNNITRTEFIAPFNLKNESKIEFSNCKFENNLEKQVSRASVLDILKKSSDFKLNYSSHKLRK